MADKSSMPMGRRQKARIAQRRRRRLIGACVIVLICLLIVFLVWMSRRTEINTGGEENEVTSSVTGDNEGLSLPELQPGYTEPPEETLPVVTLPLEETEPPEETAPVQETPAQETPAQEPEASESPGGGTANNGGTGTTGTGNTGTTGSGNNGSTGSGNQGTTGNGSNGTGNTGSTGNNGSSGSAGGQTQKPAETVTLKSGTLSCDVTSVLQGGQGKLTWKAVDSKGTDITSKCSITYKTSNCTVQGSTVTFPTAGTASVTGTITYNGTSVTTNTVSVTVTAPEPKLASVKLTGPAETARLGDTVQLTVTALDDGGKEITGDCTVAYTVSNCTVEGSSVTFGSMGAAEITAAVTYKDVTLTTETARVTVIGPLAAVTLTCTPDKGENTPVSEGDTATLYAKAVDANGTEIPGCAISYTTSGAKVEGNKATFNRGGKATITATAAEGAVTVTSNTVTVYVNFEVMLTKAGNLVVPMSQHVTNSRFGWYVCLPTLASKVVEKDADGKEIVSDSQVTYRYDVLGMTVSISSADRAKEDKATLEELYNARVNALTGENAKILASLKPSDDGYYQITWQKEETVTTERHYVGSASETTLTASYPQEKRGAAEELLTVIITTFQNGNLNTAHPAEGK